MKKIIIPLSIVFIMTSCQGNQQQKNGEHEQQQADSLEAKGNDVIDQKLEQYVKVKLNADVSHLSDNQKALIVKLIEAGKEMDKVFWKEAYGNKTALLNSIEDEEAKKLVMINYGPWDRLSGNEPFIEGVGPKPKGANFYPADMTKEELENADLEHKKSLYTIIRRDSAGNLQSIWYHDYFKDEHQNTAALLEDAADLAENEQFREYLNLRAQALLTDEYQKSDLAWLDVKENDLDVVIGPIENYEDQLFGNKAAHETFVLVKDRDWSKRLTRYADFLPRLQRELPVNEKFKSETPGRDADLAAYEVVYYAGDCNAGGKTIAINLPNDEEVQLKKGTRRLQLKNAMKAKFDKILVPISEVLIDEAQRKHITFDAFFANTMFHEVAHGLGIKNTVNGNGTVREALKEEASALEEGKADILGLYMITQLHEWGELEGDLMDYYTTFMASIFRSVRFGASSAHGRANMLRFNYFQEKGAFTRQEDGTYKINFDKMQQAMNDLTEHILVLQGEGDYDGVKNLMQEKGSVGEQLQNDLDRLIEEGIPVDIYFEQGVDVLGIEG